MTSKERLLATLNHKEPDRVPVDFGATMETTIHLQAYDRLKENLGIAVDKNVETKLFTARFAEVDVEVQEHIGADVRGVSPKPSTDHKISMEKDGEYEWFTDEWGITWRRSLDGGLYYDMWKHPLSSASEEDMQIHPFPDPRDASRFAGIDERIDRLAAGDEYPVVFDNSLGNGIFQMSNHMMGYDNFMIAMALGEARADYLLDKVTEIKMEFWDEVLERYGDRLVGVKELDDLGTQASLMLSPDMYVEKIKPRLKKLVDFIKNKAPHINMMMHSCGSIRPVIGHLIDAGVDSLNPIQYTAADMDPATLKKEFGADICFWGGGIETQYIMKNGGPGEVRDEVRKQLDIMMPGGGFVFSQVHSLQPDIPVENMLAMWEAAREYGVY